eukprot:2681141-Rhodomonas_salina.1
MIQAQREEEKGRDGARAREEAKRGREGKGCVSPLGIRWLTLPVLKVVKQASPSTTGLGPGWPG